MQGSEESEGMIESGDLPEDHRSGFVAVVGKPNVGKSTLMNAFLGEKLAIVSPKPQTTRERQLGILTRSDVQIVFADTPGIHIARSKLGEFMVDVATQSIPDADVILFLTDVSELPDGADRAIAELVNGNGHIPAILVLNKCDLLEAGQETQHREAYQTLVPEAHPILVSATEGQNVEAVLDLIINELPCGPRYYPAEQLTDTYLRDNVAEIIREKVLFLYEHEIPHSAAVVVNEFKERSEELTYVAATIFVERDSQKQIVIGKKGQMIKKLGKLARAEIAELLGTKVYLDLWVKVLKNWRKDEQALSRLGYQNRR
jgi:GTP-binding protein Era